jgi:hypothetical protein
VRAYPLAPLPLGFLDRQKGKAEAGRGFCYVCVGGALKEERSRAARGCSQWVKNAWRTFAVSATSPPTRLLLHVTLISGIQKTGPTYQ